MYGRVWWIFVPVIWCCASSRRRWTPLLPRYGWRGGSGMRDLTLSAREAAEALGVRLETLYAYVSRGLLTSERHLDGMGLPHQHGAESA